MRRVFVTGLGVVSPIGTGLEAFFAGLRDGRCGIGTVRSFDAEDLPSRIAGEVSDEGPVPDWDLEPYGPAIARDPKARFGLLAAGEALADAFPCSEPCRYHAPGRIQAHLATGLEIFHLADLLPHLCCGGELDGVSLARSFAEAPPAALMQTPAHLAARVIARRFSAEGGLSVNVSACAASTQTVGEAFMSIRGGVADLVVAGGFDSMVNPLGMGGFCLLEALSRANRRGGAASRPFDVARDGFVMGEGAAVVVLEEGEAARRRGARVHAEVLGYGASLDAFRVSDPDPGNVGPARAMRLALARAGITPNRVGYIDAHGTGTLKNDPAECRAIRAVFGAAADRIPVSSQKSQMGHLIGAAGAVEIVAGIFALQHGLVPATLHLDNPDPECDVDHVAHIPRPAEVRCFLSNSFGFGGQNASIVIASPGFRGD